MAPAYHSFHGFTFHVFVSNAVYESMPATISLMAHCVAENIYFYPMLACRKSKYMRRILGEIANWKLWNFPVRIHCFAASIILLHLIRHSIHQNG